MNVETDNFANHPKELLNDRKRSFICNQSDLFNIDETLNKVHNELASHQTRLDSIEQLAAWRLELVNFNRILSLLPKPVLPNQEENNSPWDFQEAANNLENTTGEGDGFQYPTV